MIRQNEQWVVGPHRSHDSNTTPIRFVPCSAWALPLGFPCRHFMWGVPPQLTSKYSTYLILALSVKKVPQMV